MATTDAQQRQDMNRGQSNPKILVTYFSAMGTTARAAEKLVNVTGGELYAITPTESYTSADLDWHNRQSQLGGDERPQIASPIWRDLAPRVINTFVESHDLKGKIVIPFATSGGGKLAGSAAALKRSYPALNWKEGRLLNHADEKSICTWIDKLGYHEKNLD